MSIKVGMLQVRKNEISLRKWSGGVAQWRTLEGALGTLPRADLGAPFQPWAADASRVVFTPALVAICQNRIFNAVNVSVADIVPW